MVESGLLPYESLICSYLAAPHHVDRIWLSDRVEAALEDREARVLLLTAEPGAGKTAFMAGLARRHPDWLRYFIRRDSQSALSSGDARSFLLAVGHQLAAQRPSLFHPDKLQIAVQQRLGEIAPDGKAVGIQIEDLRVSPFYRTAIQVEQQVGHLAGDLIGLAVRNAVLEERLLEPGNLQHLALLDPAAALLREEPGARIVVLVDALDELRWSPGGYSLLDWLARCPELPANVRFVLASRPEEILGELRRRQRAWLREDSIDPRAEPVRADLRRYSEGFTSRQDVREALRERGRSLEDFVGASVDKADGNFQYLAALFRAIGDALDASGGEGRLDGLLELEGVPAGLEPLYSFFLAQIRGEVQSQSVPVRAPDAGPFDAPAYIPAWEGLYVPVLGALAVAREPLTAPQIGSFVPARPAGGFLQGALDRLRQFLDEEAGRYRLYHGSLPEFLAAEGSGLPPAAEWHRGIASRYRGSAGSWEDVDWRAVDDYGLLHLSDHLYALRRTPGMERELYRLLCKPFMLAKEDRHGSLRPFAGDVDLALAAARSEQPPNLVEMVRCCVIYATLGAFTAEVPPRLVGVLARAGQVERARGLAALIQDRREQSAAWLDLGEGLLAEGREGEARNALLEAMKAAMAIEVGDFRDEALRALAPALAQAGDLERAGEVAGGIERDSGRAHALAGIAQTLIAQGLAGPAEEATLRAMIQAALVWYDPDRVACLEEVGRIAAGLAGLGRGISDAEVEEIVELVEGVEPAEARIHALAGIARVLLQAGAPDPAARVAERARLSVKAAEAQREQVQMWNASRAAAVALAHAGKIDEALETAFDIFYEGDRWGALQEIVAALVDQGSFDRAAIVAAAIEDGSQARWAWGGLARGLARAGRIESAVACLGKIADPERRGEALSELASLQGGDGQILQALEDLSAAAGNIAAPRDCVSVLAHTAAGFVRAGARDRAAREVRRAIEVANAIEDGWWRSWALRDLASALARAGAFDLAAATAFEMAGSDREDALDAVARAQIQAACHDDALATLELMKNVFNKDQRRAELAAAFARERELDRALEIIKAIGEKEKRAQSLARLAEEMARGGAAAGAVELANRMLAEARMLKPDFWAAHLMASFAWSLAKAGDEERTSKAADEALALADVVGSGSSTIGVQEKVVLALGKVGAYDRALAVAERFEEEAHAVHALEALASAHLGDGRLERSLEAIRRISYVWRRVLLLAEIAWRLVDAGAKELAADAAQAALEDVSGLPVEESKIRPLCEVAHALAGVGRREEAQELAGTAIALTQEIRDLWPPMGRMTPAEVRRSETFRNMGLRWVEGALLDRGLEAAERIEPGGRRAATLCDMADVLLKRGCLQRAAEVAERALAADQNLTERVVVLLGQAGAFDRALAVAESSPRPESRARALGQGAWMASRAGERERAGEIVEKTEAVLKGVKDKSTLVAALGPLARAHLALERPKLAARVGQRVVKLVKRLPDGYRSEELLLPLAEALLEIGLPVEAIQVVEAIDLTSLRGPALSRLARVLARGGHREHAMEAARRALAVIAGEPDEWPRGGLLREAAPGLAEAGALHAALEAALAFQYLKSRSFALRGMAEALGRAGQREPALAAWRHALAEARFLGRDELFSVLGEGLELVADLDRGATLGPMFDAVLEVERWWRPEAGPRLPA